MIRCPLIALLAFTTLAAAAEPSVETTGGVRHVRNDAEPLHGERVLRLEPVWTVNVAEEEELIGYVVDAIAGPEGTVWLLDEQLGQVLVYSAEGEYRRTLSREGEGPGEITNPDQMLWLPGGGLAIRDRKPGQLTVIDREGMPLPSVHLKARDGEPLSSSYLHEARGRSGSLAIAGGIFRQDANGAPTQGRFFALFDAGGEEVVRLLEAPSGFDFQDRTYDEPANWFVDRGAYDVDAQGQVWFAVERDAYRLHVHDASGELMQVIERAHEPRRRTAEELDDLAGGVTMNINGEIVEIDSSFSDFAPALERVFIPDDGGVWVLSGRGASPDREGAVASWDVFDAEGRFVEVVHVEAEVHEDRDRLFPLDDGRWILLRNLDAASRARFGSRPDDDAADEDEEDRPLEIVCLKAAAAN